MIRLFGFLASFTTTTTIIIIIIIIIIGFIEELTQSTFYYVYMQSR